jgi:hypothetical protein
MPKFFTLTVILFFVVLPLTLAQSRYVVVEKLGGKRLRLVEGDDFSFRLRDQTALYNDVIVGFRDSTVIISSGIQIHTKNIAAVYRKRKSLQALRIGMQTVGIGFIVFPTMAYLFSENKYSPRESITIGASMIAFGQLFRLIPKWRKYKMDKNSRIWIYE